MSWIAAGLLLAFATAMPAGASVAEHRRACAGHDGWADPAPPVRVFGQVYDVGTCGITVLLIRGDKGAVLIDTGPAEAAPIVARNIRRLGLRLRDVKLMLATHEHVDHVGGMAALQRQTGATIRLTPAASAVLRSGRVARGDPQAGSIDPPAAAKVGTPLTDGEVVRLGRLALTVHFTPGHSPGGSSWTWRACEGAACRTIAYADSLSAIARKGYRFSEHPDRVAALRRSFATVGALPCDILITPHPGASDLYPRLYGAKPLVDPGLCRAYAEGARKALDAKLAAERRSR
jgi:metallo-beta-lactamase class B